MGSFGLPGAVAVAAMSSADREAFVRSLDRERRRVEAQVALFVHTVAQVGGYLDDKHRTARAWGQAACNWSAVEAGRFVKAGDTLARFESAAALAQAGDLGVAQLHALSLVVANPQVQDHLVDGEAVLVGSAAALDFADYLTFLNRWVAAADPDSAHQFAERAHRNRRARVGVVGNECFVDAVGGAAAGLCDRWWGCCRCVRHGHRRRYWPCAPCCARQRRGGGRYGSQAAFVHRAVT